MQSNRVAPNAFHMTAKWIPPQRNDRSICSLFPLHDHTPRRVHIAFTCPCESAVCLWSSFYLRKCDWRANVHALDSSRRKGTASHRTERTVYMQQIIMMCTDSAHTTVTHTLFLIAANQRGLCGFFLFFVFSQNVPHQYIDFRHFSSMALYSKFKDIYHILHGMRQCAVYVWVCAVYCVVQALCTIRFGCTNKKKSFWTWPVDSIQTAEQPFSNHFKFCAGPHKLLRWPWVNLSIFG